MLASTRPRNQGCLALHFSSQLWRSRRASSTVRRAYLRRSSGRTIVIGLAQQMIQGITQKVNLAALPPRSGQYFPQRRLQARMIITDDRMRVVQAAGLELQ